MFELIFNEALLSPMMMESLFVIGLSVFFGVFGLATIWMLPWSQQEVDVVYNKVVRLVPSRPSAPVVLPAAQPLGK